ncbi:uncharacterized protein Z519_09057 [Cladophialophora bantiana CBS 173.52]|uniref:DUF6604 domain-containing protein n=1 Tax=Cladophialophora bantiana (strain ATCC 10958 / CBS 173.52 / CDC B-1940 / NIH 8579) TaxID=1442370 RepID=A0A0D2FV43_CLAB1|nr:uncharacterized protein Z519_09057 [Cladophialophora bantiana CBS 173.52]KIW90412.1 hypothetical protein Z519_09057 [Cladophialophora bantiana CBS 173.52]
MLLNASHKLSFSGLPPDLLDAYVRYKKNTRALLTWFLQHSPAPPKPVKSLTIKELESMAQAVSKKLRSLPDVVHFYFRETIADRKRFSNLAKIYDDLCVCCGGLKSQHRKSSSSSPVCPSLRPVNQYEGLTVEEAEDYEGQNTGKIAAPGGSKPTTPPPSSTGGQGLDIHLADDELGRALELAAAAQQIHDISSSVDLYWQLAGKGQISVAVASFITNVALASLRQVVNELLQHDEDFCFSDLHDICSFDHAASPIEVGTKKLMCTNQALLGRLQQIEQTLSDLSNGPLPFGAPSCARCGLKEAQEAQAKVIKDNANSQYLSSAIIEKIVDLVHSKAATVEIIKASTPVCLDLGDIITDPKNNTKTWSAVLGLNLLTQSYGAFLRSLPKPQMASQGRIMALKLAHQARSQVTTVLSNKTAFPCRCPQTLGCHLQNLETNLQEYASHNCWDLVFQSPWVAGNHVLEILDLCHYYGLHLLKYRHYVGAVLHSYNVLRQLGGLEENSTLEKLCSQLRDVLFPASNPPKSNFRACWARHVGARLKFEKGHKGKSKHDNWCLAIPAHAAKAAAGFDIPNHQQKVGSGCVVFHIKHKNYHVSDDQLKNLSAPLERLRQTRGEMEAKLVCKSDLPIIEPAMQNPRLLPLVLATHGVLTNGVRGFFPMARLNLFAVFERCLRVVLLVSDKMHTDNEAEKGIACICFCTEIFIAADRIVKGRRLGKLEAWKEHERKLVEDTKEAIQTVFGGISEDELLWNA